MPETIGKMRSEAFTELWHPEVGFGPMGEELHSPGITPCRDVV
jgi:hypothetical protein